MVGLLAAVALFAPVLAQHDPVENFFMLPDRNGELRMAPFEPGEVPGFPLGSDLDGRDILSRMMWAVRPTLVLATLVSTFRLVVGTLLYFFHTLGQPGYENPEDANRVFPLFIVHHLPRGVTGLVVAGLRPGTFLR